MRSCANRSALAGLVLLSSAGTAQERPAIPAFPAQADAITVDVVVVDKDGRPVPGLTRDDFTLLEDGRPQAIMAFEAQTLIPVAAPPEPAVAAERVAASGRTFAFLLDDLGTQPLNMEDVKRSLARWLREKADARDEVTLATVSGDLWWSDRVGRGRSDLEAVLARARGRKLPERTREWISEWEAYRIVTFEDATGAAAASAGPQPIPNALGRIAERVAARTDLRPPEVRMRAMEIHAHFTRRVRSLLAATERLSRGLPGSRGRKSILVFSEGFLYDANHAGFFDRAIDASQRANTAIYFVDAKGLAGQHLFGAERDREPRDVAVVSMEESFLEASGAEHVAENTGGASVRFTNDLFGGVARVTEESATYYLLGYQPEKAPDGKWRKLEVKVARPDVRVRARRGYQAAPPPELSPVSPAGRGKKATDAERAPPKRPLDPAVLTAGAPDAIPVRIAAYVLDADKAGLARVLVVLELDTARLALRRDAGRLTGAVDLTLLGLSRDQAKTFPLDERVRLEMDGKAAGGWMNLSRELRLPSGVAQVRALVRDVASGLAGAVSHRLEVPPLDGPYLATPVLTDRTRRSSDGAARLVPVAHRRFRPQGHLYCSYEVFGMTDDRGEVSTRVAGGFTLRASSGHVVRHAPPTPIAVALDGKMVRLIAIPLAGLAAGEYELVLDVVDEATGRTLRSREPFVLEPGL